ncbi:unnamed protein product [Schistosoma margrebowiei]|uniref:Uncharacterized protein n=1 Tax=Schistosoma margrebowiei TaxID=48269 RepID=A0A183MEJ0_9TREM|nr:unnamed protein product [Schistosoma margrebowiei]
MDSNLVYYRLLQTPLCYPLSYCVLIPTSVQDFNNLLEKTVLRDTQLDDLDFADDLVLLSHTHEQMQINTVSVAAVSASVGLRRTKVLKFKAENSNPVTLDGETLEDVEALTYLRSIIDDQGGSDADVKARIGKARTASLQLKNIWNPKQISTNIKVRIFNTNVKAVLLYGSETSRTTTTIIKKVQ